MSVIRLPDAITTGDFTDVSTAGSGEHLKMAIWDNDQQKIIWVTYDEWLVLLAPSFDFSSANNSQNLALAA